MSVNLSVNYPTVQSFFHRLGLLLFGLSFLAFSKRISFAIIALSIYWVFVRTQITTMRPPKDSTSQAPNRTCTNSRLPTPLQAASFQSNLYEQSDLQSRFFSKETPWSGLTADGARHPQGPAGRTPALR